MTSSSVDNVALLRKFFDAFGSGDTAAGFATLSPDITWTYYGPRDWIPFAGVFRGHKGVEAFFEIVGASVSLKEMVVESLDATEDVVYGRGRERSEVKSTGKEYNVQWSHVYRVRDGLIVSFEEFLDTAAVASAFGR